MRTWLKPRMSRVIEAAREIQPDLAVLCDSDGDVSNIIDDLLEIGVNAISPMQPECMDLDAIYLRYQWLVLCWSIEIKRADSVKTRPSIWDMFGFGSSNLLEGNRF